MKTEKIIDLVSYSQKHTSIRLDRSILYSFQSKGLQMIQNQSYKYINFENLQKVVEQHNDDALFKWYVVFDFYLKNEQKNKKDEELQKKVDLQLANLANMVFTTTRGFQFQK